MQNTNTNTNNNNLYEFMDYASHSWVKQVDPKLTRLLNKLIRIDLNSIIHDSNLLILC
jgi:hypothetical protein